MKKKLYTFLIAGMCMIVISACGKKESQTVSDNFAGMTDEIQGMDEINSMLEEKQEEANYLTDDTNENLEDMMSPDETNADDTNTDESVSDDVAGVSDNAAEADMGDMNDNDNEEVETSENDYLSNLAIGNTLNVANLSGKDLKEVYASFNVGNINNVEITSGKKLKDGNQVSYVIADAESLVNASSIVLSINAVDKKGETVSFGDVRIIDACSMNVVLTNTDDGYKMYIR